MAADPTYATKNYQEQGGADWEIGATLNIQAAGTLTAEDGATIETPTIADAAVNPGAPCLFPIPLAAGTNGATNVVLTHKTRVIDAWVVLTGAGVASETLQVGNGANAITDAMAASGVVNTISRAAQINSTYQDIAAGGQLRVTSAGGASQPAAIVYVLGIRRP